MRMATSVEFELTVLSESEENADDITDVSQLNELNEGTIVGVLKARYNDDKIYVSMQILFR